VKVEHGLNHHLLPDPIADKLKELEEEVKALKAEREHWYKSSSLD
jgi:serine O-acetyltransferase